ncbi:MAG: hypothetical protein ACI84C_002074 [Flavobacteriales bacterium]|jgi:hypothetical protein
MRLFLVLLVCACFTFGAFAQNDLGYEKLQFVSPKDNSEFHNINTCLVLRHSSELDIQGLDANCLLISGSESGSHDFEILQSSDGKTLNVVVTELFELDESVTISLGNCLMTTAGNSVEPLIWSFQTSDRLPAAWSSDLQWVDEESEFEQVSDEGFSLSSQVFPEINYIVAPNGAISPGNFFIGLRTGQVSEIAITDSIGQTTFWQDNEPEGGRNFQLSRSNLPSYGVIDPYGWRILDEYADVIDFVTMWNGYSIDWHDFQHLENGHMWLFTYDYQTTDMSEIVIGGDAEASVAGFVIQELDEDGLLLLQWRSWDYLDITDNEDNNLQLSSIDPFHINSMEADTDGNIIISMRHLNEVLKFNKETSEIMWRWGINDANSQFDFTNDDGFSHQHDVRRLPNGNIMMFDNANVTGQVSRAVEFSMDTAAHTVTKVWEYIHPEQLFGSSTGGAQRMANGNSLIYWGNVGIDQYGARFSEVDYDGNILIEFSYPIPWSSYRIRKEEWMFIDHVVGCTDETAFNFDPEASQNDPELCQYDLDEDGFSAETGDCDDTASDINPDAIDILNDGIDQDCSGFDAVDADEDGFLAEDDCDDNDADINPDGVEIPYDGIDQDCSGADLTDVDEDGFSPEDGDCDDNNSDVNPDGIEIPYDGIDQDCSGADLTDVDEDGFTPEDGDCDDNNSDVNPDGVEIPYDGIDQDCSGADLDDQDNDGFTPDEGDCDDFNEDINPDEVEIPNDGIDQDCNGDDLIIGIEEEELPFTFTQRGNDIYLNNLASGKWVARIFDVSGRMVASEEIVGSDLNISMQNLLAGVYLVSITDQVSTYAIRVIKD